MFHQCLDYFKATQQKFHQAMIEFNAWIIVARNKVKLNLNDYHVDKLVKIEVNGVQKIYTLADLPKGIELATTIHEISKSFSNYRCKFRGKQELQFFVKFLTKLKDDLSADIPNSFKQKKKISFPIPEKNPLSALTQYADTPPCLRDYFIKIG